MNLSGCSALARSTENSVWYRVYDIKYYSTSHRLSFLHPAMRLAPSRWNAGGQLNDADRFSCLYLSDDTICAQFEAEQQLGYFTPGNHAPHPKKSFVALSVRVVLQDVADLSDVGSQSSIGTSVQELTGDWKGYSIRSSTTSVSDPQGIAPTQELGHALYQTKIEAFRATSAKIPWQKNLVVFLDNMRVGSSVIYRQGSKIVQEYHGKL